MVLFLTSINVRSKPYIKGMFKCTVPGSTNPNDQNWEVATYISKKLSNGFNVGIRDAFNLIWTIKPFTEGLFQATFYEDRTIRDYALGFIIMIRIGEEVVQAGEFYFRSDRNPFEPKMEGLKLNLNLPSYLKYLYEIIVMVQLFYISDEVPVLPKPLEKTFNHDQCVICLDRKPNVLFIECNHTCVCNECEEAHPSTQCPCCRTKISRRLLI